MATITNTIELYENSGALIGVGSNQILSFTDFQASISGTLVVDDSNNDIEWDFGETTDFNGAPATLNATGTAVAGVTLQLPLLGIDLQVALSSAVQMAVLTVDGVQYLRFYNPDGTEADPQALLDGLLTDLTDAIGPALLPEVVAAVGDLSAYVANNAFLTADLSTTAGVDLVPCFAAGTLIATASGERPVEQLKVGDTVLTVDHGHQTIRWIGSRHLTADELEDLPNLRPIRIEVGALGPDLPHRDLVVSPQHRCLLRSRIANRMAGAAEILVAAKHLLGTKGVSEVDPAEGVTYYHLLFDRHELVWSNGAVTESFFLGDQALNALDREARREVIQLFPELDRQRPPPARPFVRGRIARKLVERARQNRKSLVEQEQALDMVKARRTLAWTGA